MVSHPNRWREVRWCFAGCLACFVLGWAAILTREANPSLARGLEVAAIVTLLIAFPCAIYGGHCSRCPQCGRRLWRIGRAAWFHCRKCQQDWEVNDRVNV